MNKYIYILLFLTFCSLFAVDNIDSLEKVLTKQTDQEKLSTLDVLSRTYSAISNEKRLQYSHEFLYLSENIGNDSIVANANMAMGISFFYVSEIDSAAKYVEIALQKYTELKDTARMAACINNLGIIFHQTGRYKKSIEYYYKSLELKESANDTLGIAIALNNMGSIYYDWGKYDKSLDFFIKAKKYYYLKNDSIQYPLVYRNFGTVYFAKAIDFLPDSSIKQYVESPNIFLLSLGNLNFKDYKLNDSTKKYLLMSLENYRKSLDLYEYFEDEEGIAEIKNSLGVIKRYQNDFDEALKLHDEAVVVFRKNNNLHSLSKALVNKGITLVLSGETAASVEVLEEGLKFAYQMNSINIAADAHNGLIVAYKTLGQPEKALEHSFSLMEVQDSLFNEENIRMLEELEMKYRTDKSNSELQLSKKNEEVLQQQIIILIISIATVLIIAGGLFFRNRYKSKVNNVLVKNNEELTDLNHKLKISELNLKEANDTKDRFFSIIAHDLRNPMSSFISIIKMLKKDYDHMSEDDIHEIIDALDNSSDKVFLLLENLLTWSRSQRGKISYTPSDEVLHTLAQMSVEPLLTTANDKKIEILNKINPDIRVHTDVNLTNTIIRNLVSNAIKFSHENSVIEIYEETLEDKIKVTVKDHGTGISPEVVDDLFHINKDVTHSGTKGEKGTGLGLIICKEFTEMQGGQISVESEEGKGSNFSFTLNKAGDNG